MMRLEDELSTDEFLDFFMNLDESDE